MTVQILAFSTGATALSVALFIALTGAGARRDRIGRFLIPSPLFVGAPLCGVILSFPQPDAVVALASIATVLATIAMVPLLVMIGALMPPTILRR